MVEVNRTISSSWQYAVDWYETAKREDNTVAMLSLANDLIPQVGPNLIKLEDEIAALKTKIEQLEGKDGK